MIDFRCLFWCKICNFRVKTVFLFEFLNKGVCKEPSYFKFTADIFKVRYNTDHNNIFWHVDLEWKVKLK